MTAQLLDGNAFLESVKRDLAERVKRLGDRGVTPGLGTILVGDDESSAVYVRLKHENSGEIGIASFGRELPATTTQEELFAVIREYNENPEIDAFLVQLPLPKHLDEEETLRAVDPDKDVDGLHPVNLGKLRHGRRRSPRVHAGGHPGAARPLRRADRGATRRDRRPGHSTSAVRSPTCSASSGPTPTPP